MPNPNRKPDPIVTLDDPDFELVEDAPSTKRPDVPPDQYAQHVESAEDRVTMPPSPTYEMLRDSCRSMQVADVADELRPGDASHVHRKDGATYAAARAAVAAADALKRKASK